MGDLHGVRRRIQTLVASEQRTHTDQKISAELAGAAITLARNSGMSKEEFLCGIDSVWDMYELLFENGELSQRQPN